MTSARPGHIPWDIHFFQRSRSDDPDESVPAAEFLEQLPGKIEGQIWDVLHAVAEAPPPAFAGGGKWKAMHGEMAGIYEICVQGGGRNHRLFCLLVRGAVDLGGSSIVCLGGLSKPPRQAADPRIYRLIRKYKSEFERHRRTLN